VNGTGRIEGPTRLPSNVPYPGFGQTWGVVSSVVLIAVIAGTLYAMFKRKGWL
jgi:magnesium transporter